MKTKSNPTSKFKRLFQFMAPANEIIEVFYSITEQPMPKINTPKGRDRIRVEHMLSRKYPSSEVEVYVARFLRAYWLIQDIHPKDAHLLRIQPRIYKNYHLILRDFLTFDEDLKDSFETDMKDEWEDEEQSFLNECHNLYQLFGDSIAHFYSQYDDFITKIKTGRAKPWHRLYVKLIKNVKPKRGEEIGEPETDAEYIVTGHGFLGRLSEAEIKAREIAEETDFLSFDDVNHKIFKNIDSKWAWFIDEKGWCEVTAEYLKHCGNKPSRRDGDLLLNLGEKVENAGYIPRATFILNGGILGEMKGRANSKPSPKYHPQIVELLRDPRIKWVAGGGYQAENNFEFEDLDKDVLAELKKDRPELFDIDKLFETLTRGKTSLDSLFEFSDELMHIRGVLQLEPYANGSMRSFVKSLKTLLLDLETLDLIDNRDHFIELLDLIGEGEHIYNFRSWLNDWDKSHKLSVLDKAIKEFKKRSDLTAAQKKAVLDNINNHLDPELGNYSEPLDDLIENSILQQFTHAKSDLAESMAYNMIEDLRGKLGLKIELQGDLMSAPKAFVIFTKKDMVNDLVKIITQRAALREIETDMFPPHIERVDISDVEFDRESAIDDLSCNLANLVKYE